MNSSCPGCSWCQIARGSKSQATEYKNHDLKLLRNTDLTKIEGKYRFIHHINC